MQNSTFSTSNSTFSMSNSSFSVSNSIQLCRIIHRVCRILHMNTNCMSPAIIIISLTISLEDFICIFLVIVQNIKSNAFSLSLFTLNPKLQLVCVQIINQSIYIPFLFSLDSLFFIYIKTPATKVHTGRLDVELAVSNILVLQCIFWENATVIALNCTEITKTNP